MNEWIEMPGFFFKLHKSDSDIRFSFRKKMFSKNGTVKTSVQGSGYTISLSELKRMNKINRLTGDNIWAYEYVKEHYPEYLI